MEQTQVDVVQSQAGLVGGLIGGLFGMIIVLGITLFFVVCIWKIFTKAGHPGWAALIPFYNVYIMLQIAGRPAWWMILLIVPLVNMIVSIVVNLDIAKNFGKSTLFGVASLFVPWITMPILAFGDATYIGPKQA